MCIHIQGSDLYFNNLRDIYSHAHIRPKVSILLLISVNNFSYFTRLAQLRARSHRASAAASASSLVMGHIDLDLQWFHTHQASAAASSLAMMLGIGPEPI